jgi:arylsulfatase A-like enzyme/Tfp pilus assembly protein PilF
VGSEPPNVLLITIDTLRADRIGCYGGPAPTPSLDALASRGVRFATALAPAPLTAPSHASILTGLNPPRHGVRDNGAFVLPESIPVLAGRFRAAGYETAAFVSGFPLDRRFGLARAFDAYDDRLPRGRDPRRASFVERPADQTARAARDWLAGRSQRWFAWVHFFDPHSPYEPPQAFGPPRTETPYDGEIAFVDHELGALLRALDPRTQASTVVLATADHGESLGDHGEETHGVFVYDATLRVPMLLAGPGIPRGGVSTTLARLVDVAPTLLELAGLPPLAGVDGRSLAGAARGDALPEEPAYAESLFASLQLGWAPLHALRTTRFKLVRAPRPELYAVDRDPGESHDLASERPAVLRELSARLEPLLSVEAPRAAATPDGDAAERLRALGYLGAASARLRPASVLKDPKDGIALVNQLERGLANARSDPEGAIRDLSAALAQDPGLPLARRYLALARFTAGDATGAIRELEALERAGKAEVDDLLLLAEALRPAGRHAEALAALDRAGRLAPGSPDVPNARGRAYAALGRLAEARRAFEAALAIAPEHPEAQRGLGELALVSGDAAEARARFESILARDPEDVRSLVKLGVVALRQGRPDEALARFEAAVALAPRDAEALLDLGGLLAKLGRTAEAIPMLERAVAAGARSPVALNSLGFARLQAGDPRGALEALGASLAIERRQPEIASAVARLEAELR